MSNAITHKSWFSRKLGKNTFQVLGAGALLSGAVLFGACGDDDDDDVDLPTTGAGSTITTVTGTTTGSSPTTMAGTTTSGTPSTGRTTTPGSGSGTPTTGSPTTGTPGAGDGDVMSIFENEFSDRPWYTAVEDVELDNGEALVKVNDEAATLTESEVEEMCNEVSDVVFSDALGTVEEVDMLTVEDESGTELATASAAGECSVA